EYVLQRNGKALPPLTITPKLAQGRGVIGVSPKQETIYRPLSARDASLLALLYPFELTLRNLEGMADLIQRRTTEGITGPVGMGKLVAEQAEKGAFAFTHVLIA